MQRGLEWRRGFVVKVKQVSSTVATSAASNRRQQFAAWFQSLRVLTCCRRGKVCPTRELTERTIQRDESSMMMKVPDDEERPFAGRGACLSNFERERGAVVVRGGAVFTAEIVY